MSNEMLLLRDLIGERAGMFMHDQFGLGFFERCIESRMTQVGCESLADYHHLLARCTEAAETEFLQLITALAKPASSFFRHVATSAVLTDIVLPLLLEQNTDRDPVIWSAGCSTGEEPFALTMALNEAGWFERLDITIEAFDGKLDSIAKARAGEYAAKRIRSLAPELRDKYFVPVNNGWKAMAALQERINWSVANLARDDAFIRYPRPDIIFCQQVFIYFSDTGIERVLRRFEKQLWPGGYLFSDQGDHFEGLVSRLDLFDRVEFNRLSLWRKRGDEP